MADGSSEENSEGESICNSLQIDEEELGNDFEEVELEEEMELSTRKRKNKTEVDGDVNTEGHDELSPPKKKKKKKVSVSTKPPTAEEMTRLRETENLFHSNLFRMQIEELLKEVKLKKKKRHRMKIWFEKLRTCLLSLDEDDSSKLSFDELPENIKFPHPWLRHEDVKVTRFEKPTSVFMSGSFNSGCSLGPSFTLDVTIVIPKACLLKSDYLNGRYHRNRALYLCRVASALQSSQLIKQDKGISWTLAGGNALSPQLTFWHTDVKVTVSAVPHSSTFKLTRFTPDKNNVRESWLSSNLEDCQTPTPVYNTSIVKDCVHEINETVRRETLENHNNLKDAICLLRVWLRQRQLDVGLGGFSGYLASMLVVALSRSRHINPLMSSYQIVRNIWLFIERSDWTKEGFSMCTNKEDPNRPSLEEFHRHFDVVFVDTTGYCNLAADMHRLTYLRVKEEARLAIQWLDDPNISSFQALFMTQMPFFTQFDHVICLSLSKQTKSSILLGHSKTEQICNHLASRDVLVTRIITDLLERGLGNRLERMAIKLPQTPEWPVNTAYLGVRKNLVIGLRLDAEHAYSVIAKGPPANEPGAAEFRALWGERSHLRRFRDGSVCEAVGWGRPTAPLAHRRMIASRMVRLLLKDQLDIEESDVTYVADQLEPFVIEKHVRPRTFEYGSGEEAALAVTRVFDNLVRQLRELPDLPLDLTSVQGVSSVFRGAEVFPPLARQYRPPPKATIMAEDKWLLEPGTKRFPEYISPIEGIINLSQSQKWPEHLEAVRYVKAAFHIRIAKQMKEKYNLQTQPYPEYVDICKEGFVFRMHVVYSKEVALMKKIVAPDGKLSYRDNPESLRLEQFTDHLPKLTGALHGLERQWAGFGVVCRLAKRWLSAQLIDSWHMPEMATELLVAFLFLSPEPFRPLLQPQPMFLRFLRLLANTNWNLEPIIVNFNGDLKRDDIVEIESHFRNERTTLPPLVIATQYDKIGSCWTREAPVLPVLARMAQLAKQALVILENPVSLLAQTDIMFRPPLKIYDVLIEMHPKSLPRYVYNIDCKVERVRRLKPPEKKERLPIVRFDPAQFYLHELRESYGEFALFFHDTYGGNIVGVLFKPTAFEKKDFKISHMNGRKPIQQGDKTYLIFNIHAMLEDLSILGKGFIKSVTPNENFMKKINCLDL